MPVPGIPNNPAGINGYEEIDQEKELTRAIPIPPAPGVSAPRKAQRRAGRGGGRMAASPPAPPPTAQAQGEMQSQAFWQSVLNDPGASPLARAYAQAALGG